MRRGKRRCTSRVDNMNINILRQVKHSLFKSRQNFAIYDPRSEQDPNLPWEEPRPILFRILFRPLPPSIHRKEGGKAIFCSNFAKLCKLPSSAAIKRGSISPSLLAPRFGEFFAETLQSIRHSNFAFFPAICIREARENGGKFKQGPFTYLPPFLAAWKTTGGMQI